MITKLDKNPSDLKIGADKFGLTSLNDNKNPIK